MILTALAAPAFAAVPLEEPLSLRAGLVGGVPEKRMPAVDTAKALAEDAQPKGPTPLRFALTHDVKIGLDQGRWDMVGDQWVWRLRVTSNGAKSLNLGFTSYWMPPGGTLNIYPADYAGNAPSKVRRFSAADNEAHGQLWTPVIESPSVIVEAVVPEAARAQLRLELTKVNHGYRSFRREDLTIKSGACNVDVVCPQGDPYRDQIRSVVAMQLNGSRLCSGSMINNTGAKRPLFITADHCGLRANNAASLVVYWNFQNSTCRPVGSGSSGGDGNGQLNQFNSGSRFLATFSTSDVSLAELDDDPQSSFNVYLAGWDRRPGPFNDGAVGIHHPGVDEKRISLSNRATEDDRGTHHRVWWRPNGIGVTEPGSSGSPIYSKQGRFIGQLTGGGSACGVPDSAMWDVYGKLSRSWDGGGTATTRVRDYLDPVGSAAMMIDGRNWNDGGTPTPTPSPTATPSPTPTPRPTLTPTATPTPTPTQTPGGLVEITPGAGGVTASTNDGNVPGNTVDNNLGTRWSGSGDGAFLQFNLGSSRVVSRVSVAVYRGNERRNRFDLQYSTNGTTWQAIPGMTDAQTSGTSLNEQAFDFAAVTAQYIRYVGHGATLNAGGTTAWNSVTEVSIFTPTGPVPTATPTPVTPTPTPTPTSTPVPGGNLALNRPATGSTACAASEGPEKAVNGSVSGGNSDKWCSLVAGTKFLQVDLGSVMPVGSFTIRHAGAGGESTTWNTRDFTIQAGTDTTNLTNVVTVTNNTASVTTHTITARTARYIRLNITAPTQAGTGAARIYELEVYAAGGPVPTPTPTPPGTDVVIGPGDVLNDQIFEWRAGFVARRDGTYGQYRIEMSPGTAYTFTTSAATGGGGNTYLYVLNASLQVVAEDDNAAGNGHARVTVQSAAGGTHYVRLRAFSAGASGRCRLSVGGATGNALLPDLVTLANAGSLRDAFVSMESGRKRMRFSNGVANRGAGALEVFGVVDSAGATQAYQNVYNDNGSKSTYHVGTFSFAGHQDHNHWHFDNFALYELRTTSDALVASSGKVTFCIEDFERYTDEPIPGTPPNRVYDCSNQGLSRGWTDRYRSHLDGQWIDITGVANGTYRLVSTADPELRLHEITRANNRAEVTLTINGNSVTVQ